MVLGTQMLHGGLRAGSVTVGNVGCFLKLIYGQLEVPDSLLGGEGGWGLGGDGLWSSEGPEVS